MECGRKRGVRGGGRSTTPRMRRGQGTRRRRATQATAAVAPALPLATPPSAPLLALCAAPPPPCPPRPVPPFALPPHPAVGDRSGRRRTPPPRHRCCGCLPPSPAHPPCPPPPPLPALPRCPLLHPLLRLLRLLQAPLRLPRTSTRRCERTAQTAASLQPGERTERREEEHGEEDGMEEKKLKEPGLSTTTVMEQKQRRMWTRKWRALRRGGTRRLCPAPPSPTPLRLHPSRPLQSAHAAGGQHRAERGRERESW